LKLPSVDDWNRINRATPRLVDALPNGPRGFATAQVFMAGGVPEVMLHLRRMGLLNGRCSPPPAPRSTRRSTGGSRASGGRRHAHGSRRRRPSIRITS
jgi:hypothetical protein